MKTLIIVDIQNDFLPGGALAVPDGDTIIPTINALMPQFDLVVATQDWHPLNHGSFASNHAGRNVGEFIELGGLQQILWPNHCVQGSTGAEFAPLLQTDNIHRVFQKGTDSEIDSYSGFFDNGHKKGTGLKEFLEEKKVTDVYVLGLATDYCVKFTALDAVELGFRTFVIEDASKGVNLQPDDSENAIKEMQAKGIHMIQSGDILKGTKA